MRFLKIVTPCFAAALITAASLFPVGCSKKADPDQSGNDDLRMAIESDITTLDPAMLTDPVTFRIMGQIFEGLLSLDENNQAKPALAESWESNEAGDVWTFSIRAGVFFHESEIFGEAKTRELTAADVVHSLERSVAPGSISGFVLGKVVKGVGPFQAGEADHVSGISVVEGNKVRVELVKPERYFIYRLTSPYMAAYPPEAFEEGNEAFTEMPVGTGPFRVVENRTSELLLERHAKYWQGNRDGWPYRLAIRVIKNDQLKLLELRNGKVDILPVSPALVPGTVEKTDERFVAKGNLSADFQVGAFPGFSSHFVGFHTEKVSDAVRRAISVAIDREQVLEAITHETGILHLGTVPRGLQGYEPPFDGDIFDREEAREILAKEGIEPGSVTIELLVHELDSTEALGELLQAQLAEIGIRLELLKLDFNQVMQRMIEGNFEALAMKFQYVYSSPEPILTSVFHSSEIPAPNLWRYRSPEVDALIESYATAESREELNAISQKVERKVIDDAPAAFLYQSQNLFLFPKEIEGLTFDGHGMPQLWDLRRKSNP